MGEWVDECEEVEEVGDTATDGENLDGRSAPTTQL